MERITYTVIGIITVLWGSFILVSELDRTVGIIGVIAIIGFGLLISKAYKEQKKNKNEDSED